MSNYLQYRRNLKGVGTPQEVIDTPPKPKSLNKSKPKPRSAKLAKEMQQYIPEMKQFLIDNPVCALNLKGCTVKATCVDHTRGRTGSKLRNQADWNPACHNCNGKVETIGKAAYDKGLKKQRNGKPIRK